MDSGISAVEWHLEQAARAKKGTNRTKVRIAKTLEIQHNPTIFSGLVFLLGHHIGRRAAISPPQNNLVDISRDIVNRLSLWHHMLGKFA